ncbi:MAG: hypothetical protein ACP5QK_10945 [Myxococcota bacterium]
MNRRGLLLRDFKKFVMEQSGHLIAHAKAMAQCKERPYTYLDSQICKGVVKLAHF